MKRDRQSQSGPNRWGWYRFFEKWTGICSLISTYTLHLVHRVCVCVSATQCNNCIVISHCSEVDIRISWTISTSCQSRYRHVPRHRNMSKLFINSMKSPIHIFHQLSNEYLITFVRIACHIVCSKGRLNRKKKKISSRIFSGSPSASICDMCISIDGVHSCVWHASMDPNLVSNIP